MIQSSDDEDNENCDEFIQISDYIKEPSEEENIEEGASEGEIDLNKEKMEEVMHKSEEKLKSERSNRKLNLGLHLKKKNFDSSEEEKENNKNILFHKKTDNDLENPFGKKETPTFSKNMFKNKLRESRLKKDDDIDKEILLNELVKSPKSSSKKRLKKKKNENNIRIENFKILPPKPKESKPDSEKSFIDSGRSLLREKRILKENIKKLKKMREMKLKARSKKTSVEERAEIGKNVILEEFEVNKKLKKSIVEKKLLLEESGKDRESLVKVIEDKLKVLAILRRKVKFFSNFFSNFFFQNNFFPKFFLIMFFSPKIFQKELKNENFI